MAVVRELDNTAIGDIQDCIAQGGVAVIPTDTVYGIVCDPHNADAIARIYAIKQRPHYKSLQVLLASTDQIDELGLALPVPLNRLAAQFCPGAFSPIAVAQDSCTLQTLHTTPTGQRTQGIRIPNSALTLRLLRTIGPVAASSANRSGERSAQTVEEAIAAFGDDVDIYVDGGATPGHVASTVVAADPLARDGIEILREGVIPAAVIRKAIHVNGGGLGA